MVPGFGGKMLTRYIHEAMKLAKYRILDDGSYYGDIPGFRGVLANADVLEECRDELQETLEEWILLGIRLGHNLPEANGVRLITETV
jgi:predicted RNase H-like HicB family nuclease